MSGLFFAKNCEIHLYKQAHASSFGLIFEFLLEQGIRKMCQLTRVPNMHPVYLKVHKKFI